MPPRPPVNYTMTWDCSFVIDGKVEEVTVMTDDFEDVYAEYLKLKKQHKSVVFLEHKIHRKGMLVLSNDMLGIPEAAPDEAQIIDADAPLRGNVQRVRNAAARGDIREMRADEGWMRDHNRDIAARQLREPPQDKV